MVEETPALKKAYLIQGLPSCGKTTFGQQKAAEEGGECLSFDNFFYTVVEPDEPEKYSFDKRRLRSSSRYFWLQLKSMCDKGISPIYIDQLNLWQEHTWRTAAFMVERYAYDVQLIETQHPLWLKVKSLLTDRDSNTEEILAWAHNAVAVNNDQKIDVETMLSHINRWKFYTIEDIYAKF